MSNIKADLFKMYQNEKVVDLFSESDGGQGMLYKKVEKVFTFEEISNLSDVILQNNNQEIREFYQSFPNVIMFVSNFDKKIISLINEYKEIGSNSYIKDLINANKEEIKLKFPAKTSKESFEIFLKHYMTQYSNQNNTFSSFRQSVEFSL